MSGAEIDSSFVRRAFSAVARRVSSSDADEFAGLVKLHEDLGEMLAQAAMELTDTGTSWNQIAEAVGIPVATARDRWQTRDPVARGPVVYGLRERDTEEVRYVGQSKNAGARYAAHLSDAWRSSAPVATWIRRVTPARVEMIVLERLLPDDAFQLDRVEAKWIERLALDGHRLTNVRHNPFLANTEAVDASEENADERLRIRNAVEAMNQRILSEKERTARDRILSRPMAIHGAWWQREVEKLVLHADLVNLDEAVIRRLDSTELWPFVQKARDLLRASAAAR